MERDKLKEPANILAARPNGRTTAPLVVNRNGPRKSLFTNVTPTVDRVAENAENHPVARPTSSASSSDRGTSSPRTSKIPRPAQQPLSSGRKPFTLKEAYRMATREEEDAAQGSPSPAPRLWRSKTTPKENRAPNSPSHRSPRLGLGRRGPRASTESLGRQGPASSVESFDSGTQKSEVSASDIDQKLKEFEEEQMRQNQIDGNASIFSTQKLGPKVAETGTRLSRKASNNSLDGGSPNAYQPWGTKAKSSRGWLKRVLGSPGSNDGDREYAGRDGEAGRRSTSSLGAVPRGDSPARRESTPNKSFAWLADEEFTAGDLQISESPPVKAGRALQSAANDQPSDNPQSKPRNTRLDEIRSLEIAAAEKFPLDTANSTHDEGNTQETNPGDDGQSPHGRQLGRTNTKLDEIRAREIETLSKRALATARLDEIRERNAEFRPRSTSPELARKSSKDLLSDPTTLGGDARTTTTDSKPKEVGEQIPNTPVTVFKKSLPVPAAKSVDGTAAGGSQPSRGSSILRSDSHDLLRQLARAASTSPSSEPQLTDRDVKDIRRAVAGLDKIESGNPKKDGKLDKAQDEPKPKVGFAGLRREPSMESTNSNKRSSLAASDSDPTERIERELQLFAPMENYSERGSLRAPSPELEEEHFEEETPRPTKPDPLTQPTPRVTGAYVETPATIKVEKMENITLPEIIEPGHDKPTSEVAPDARGRRALSSSPRKSVNPLPAKGDGEVMRSSSLLRGRRSKSLPRVRSPLINSSRPPTVKDDLLEIHRAQQIEDTTLDDFSELLIRQGDASPPAELLPLPQDCKDIIMTPDGKMKVFSSYEEEQEAYARMTKALKAGLDDIKTAKRGIERLQDKVSHAETKPKLETPHVTHRDPAERASCPICVANGSRSSSTMVAYIHLPVPRLWHRKPRFRFTFLGLIIFLLSFWYIAESTMCSFYCRPDACYPGQPCDWSHDDPFWGYSIPVKIDQWATGGKGRDLASQLAPEIADWTADLWDAITGTDFTKVDTTNFNWDQRKQHRRRLIKRGLVKPLVELPEDRAKHAAWRAAAAAKERADALREMGYDADEEESMTVDEKVNRW